MNIPALKDHLDTPAPWIADGANLEDVVASSRIRIARNLRAAPFPAKASPEQRQFVLDAVQRASQALPGPPLAWFKTDSLTPQERRLARERRLLTPQLLESPIHAAFAVNADTSTSVLVNEEDHLRIQRFAPGLDVFGTWQKIVPWDDLFTDQLDIAFSNRLGFLTACPTNLGTGLRASVALHLPALAMNHQIETILRGALKLGLTVRGIFGEGSDATGHMYQLSNQSTLGEDEDQIVARIDHIARQLAWAERNARRNLLYNDPTTLYDYIGRAFAILGHSHRISVGEALNHLGALRLGAALELVDAIRVSTVDRLLLKVQTGHVTDAAHLDSATEQDEAAARAAILRSALKNAAFIQNRNP